MTDFAALVDEIVTLSRDEPAPNTIEISEHLDEIFADALLVRLGETLGDRAWAAYEKICDHADEQGLAREVWGCGCPKCTASSAYDGKTLRPCQRPA